jgi:hypothetical protein
MRQYPTPPPAAPPPMVRARITTAAATTATEIQKMGARRTRCMMAVLVLRVGNPGGSPFHPSIRAPSEIWFAIRPTGVHGSPRGSSEPRCPAQIARCGRPSPGRRSTQNDAARDLQIGVICSRAAMARLRPSPSLRLRRAETAHGRDFVAPLSCAVARHPLRRSPKRPAATETPRVPTHSRARSTPRGARRRVGRRGRQHFATKRGHCSCGERRVLSTRWTTWGARRSAPEGDEVGDTGWMRKRSFG